MYIVLGLNSFKHTPTAVPQVSSYLNMMLKSVLVAFGAIRAVHGWGVLGHATVAYIAQHFLDDDVASW